VFFIFVFYFGVVMFRRVCGYLVVCVVILMCYCVFGWLCCRVCGCFAVCEDVLSRVWLCYCVCGFDVVCGGVLCCCVCVVGFMCVLCAFYVHFFGSLLCVWIRSFVWWSFMWVLRVFHGHFVCVCGFDVASNRILCCCVIVCQD